MKTNLMNIIVLGKVKMKEILTFSSLQEKFTLKLIRLKKLLKFSPLVKNVLKKCMENKVFFIQKYVCTKLNAIGF